MYTPFDYLYMKYPCNFPPHSHAMLCRASLPLTLNHAVVWSIRRCAWYLSYRPQNVHYTFAANELCYSRSDASQLYGNTSAFFGPSCFFDIYLNQRIFLHSNNFTRFVFIFAVTDLPKVLLKTITNKKRHLSLQYTS